MEQFLDVLLQILSNKLYFDMKAVHGRGNMLKNIPDNINETTPLFNNKTDEHNTD